MRFLDRILGRTTETRAEDLSWTALQALGPAGGSVTARQAEGLSTVLACVSAILTAIASLPAFVFRRLDGGRTLDRAHPLMALVRRGPNEHQTWPDFCEWLIASTLLRGNGLAEIVTDPRGAGVGLVPIPWEHVSVQLLPSGRLVYDVTQMTALGGGKGRTRHLLQGEVLTSARPLGRRPARPLQAPARHQSRERRPLDPGLLRRALKQRRQPFGRPRGARHAQGRTARALEKKRFAEAFGGPSNTAKALVLESDTKWKQVSISPEDAELLASRRFQGEELCRLYGVPPPIIGDLTHGTFTNSETAGRWFAEFTLTPWIRKIETEFTRSVFTEAARASHELELDLSGFLRGDPETRWASHEIAVKNHILTPNKVRLVEGWNPREGGDDFPQGAADG